jgi:superfamily II DNA or RNA helicase
LGFEDCFPNSLIYKVLWEALGRLLFRCERGILDAMQAQVNLRDYQRECLAAIFNRYKAGIRRQLVCLPTGTGNAT